MGKINKFTKEQIDSLYKYYPIRNWEKLELFFPNNSHKQITEAAIYRNIKQLYPHLNNITGQKFGKLTALYYNHNTKKWICKCECGNYKETKLTYLRTGHVKSCGCYNKTKYKDDNSFRLNSTEKDYIVYLHVSPSEKVYVGITHTDLNKRFQNGKGYNRQKYFYRAIIKYGWDNFEHKILEKNLTYKDAIEKEKYYISLYNSTNPNCGYNVSNGGSGVSDNGYPVAQLKNNEIINVYATMEECGNKLNVAGFTISKYIKDKKEHGGFKFIKITKEEYYLYLKNHSYNEDINRNFKEKINIELKNIRKNNGNKNKVYINQYSLDGNYIDTYYGINETEKLLGISNISAAIKNNWSAGGYIWKRTDGKNITHDKNVSKKEVICITNKMIFKSGIDAAKWCGIKNHKDIYACCRNKKGHLTAGKIPNTNIRCQWKFYDEYLESKAA